jgi:mono/diheme cytochrome c family protein
MRTVIITVILTLAAVAAFFYLVIIRQGFSARTKPSAIEDFLIEQARDLATPRSDKNMKNPYPEMPQGMAEAREHWVDHCAVCHGLDGKGKTDIGRNQYPPAPDMTGDTQEMTDGQIYSTIVNGIRFSGMPAWGNEHTPEQNWHLVSFIRHVPKLTPEELKQMQQMAGGEAGEHEHPAGQQAPHTHTHPPGTPPHQHTH